MAPKIDVEDLCKSIEGFALLGHIGPKKPSGVVIAEMVEPSPFHRHYGLFKSHFESEILGMTAYLNSPWRPDLTWKLACMMVHEVGGRIDGWGWSCLHEYVTYARPGLHPMMGGWRDYAFGCTKDFIDCRLLCGEEAGRPGIYFCMREQLRQALVDPKNHLHVEYFTEMFPGEYEEYQKKDPVLNEMVVMCTAVKKCICNIVHSSGI